jgi:hypothetical protein
VSSFSDVYPENAFNFSDFINGNPSELNYPLEDEDSFEDFIGIISCLHTPESALASNKREEYNPMDSLLGEEFSDGTSIFSAAADLFVL